MNQPIPLPPFQDRLLRLKMILQFLPISRSTWWKGIKAGKYPQGIRIGKRTTVWRHSDVAHLIESPADIGSQGANHD